MERESWVEKKEWKPIDALERDLDVGVFLSDAVMLECYGWLPRCCYVDADVLYLFLFE